METIQSAVKSTESIAVSENIKAVCKAIVRLKEENKESEVKAFLETVNFESAFEKLVAIKLIDAFKLKDNLMNAFLTEDLFVISQSLKCSWFFEDKNGFLLDKNIILTFFSNLSYSGRCKVIRKYSKKLQDSNKAENLFAVIKEFYGVKPALELLPACSESFITDVIYSKEGVPTPFVVKQLYTKYPDLTVDFLFSYYEKRNNGNERRIYNQDYSSTLTKMASDKTSMFVEFWIKYGSKIQLDDFGRHVSRKIVKENFSSVLRNIDNFKKILNFKLIVGLLSRTQIEELHFCVMQKTVDDFDDSFNHYYKDENQKILSCLKKPFAEDLLLKNFRKKYGKEPLDLRNHEWMDMFPQETRAKWAEMKLSDEDLSDKDKAKYCAYLPFDKGFAALKKLIHTALDLGERLHVIDNMMQNAKINRDVGGAVQIVKYVIERHRNDSSQVRGKPLEDIKEGFDLVQLSEEQWAPIIELLNIIILNKDINMFSNELIILYENWIHCRLIAGLPIDDAMQTLLKHVTHYYSFSIAPGTKYEAYCLNWFNDNLESKNFANDNEKSYFAVTLFCTINKFNRKHPNARIEHKDWIVSLVKEKLEHRFTREEIIKSLKHDKALRNKIYDSIFPKVALPEVLLYKLNHNVADLSNHSSEIIRFVMNESCVYHYKSFFQKLILHMDLPKKFIDQCLVEIKSEDEENTARLKGKGIILLSFLGNPNAFLSFIEQYYPKGSKADCEGTEAYDHYTLQTNVSSALKNINPPYKALDAIRKFSVGDYLKLVLGSFLSVALKISQTKAIKFVHENLDTPLSFRKHVIRIFRLIGSKTDVSSYLLAALKTERNASLRVPLFNMVFDLMRDNMCSESWEAVKQAFLLMNDTDLKLLEKRIYHHPDITTEFISEYIELVWATLNRISASNNVKMNIFDSLLNERSITLIPNDLADTFFNLVYSCEETRHEASWNSYVSLYLNYSKPDILKSRLNKVIQFIRNKFGNSRDRFEKLPPLIVAICSGSLADEVTVNPFQLLSDLHLALLQIIPEHEIFSASLQLSLFKIYLKHKSDTTEFTNEICRLIDTQCATYGSYLIHVFASIVRHFISSHFEDGNVLLLFCHTIFSSSMTPINKMLAIICLPTVDDSSPSEKKMYKFIMDEIESSSDQSLKILARFTNDNI